MVNWMTFNADVSRNLRTLFEEFRASYVLHFVPRGVDPGGVHTLTGQRETSRGEGQSPARVHPIGRRASPAGCRRRADTSERATASA